MKDVVLDEKGKSNFENLLIKICSDLNVNNYKEEIDKFLEKTIKKT